MTATKPIRKDFQNDTDFQAALTAWNNDPANKTQDSPVIAPANARGASTLTIQTLSIGFENGSLVGTFKNAKNEDVVINLPSAFNNTNVALMLPKFKGGKRLDVQCYVNAPDASVGRNNYQFLRPTDEWFMTNDIDILAAAEVEESVGRLAEAKLKTGKARAERRSLWA